jgi:hypothetical protein
MPAAIAATPFSASPNLRQARNRILGLPWRSTRRTRFVPSGWSAGLRLRQGLRFLRTELPGILAKRSDVLSLRMMRHHRGFGR